MSFYSRLALTHPLLASASPHFPAQARWHKGGGYALLGVVAMEGVSCSVGGGGAAHLRRSVALELGSSEDLPPRGTNLGLYLRHATSCRLVSGVF